MISLWDVVEKLVNEGKLVELEYEEKRFREPRFYMRKLPGVRQE